MLIFVTFGSLEKLRNGEQNHRELCSRCNGIHPHFILHNSNNAGPSGRAV